MTHGVNRYYRLDDLSVLAAVRKHAPSLRGRLLDLGCGSSPYSEVVSPHVTRYVGCDRGRSAQGPDVVADAARLPLEGNPLGYLLLAGKLS